MTASRKFEKQVEDELAAARARYAKQGKRLSYLEEVRIEQRLTKDLPAPSYTAIADHIDHAVKVGESITWAWAPTSTALTPRHAAWKTSPKFPTWSAELARRGYSEEDLEKILGGNVLRVMRQVEQVSRQMQAAR